MSEDIVIRFQEKGGMEMLATPLLTSRIDYDLDTGAVDCTVTLRNGRSFEMHLSRADRMTLVPPAFSARIALIRRTLIAWGVGDERWHRRDVGRCTDILLALQLPQDDAVFAESLALPDPDRIAGYLSAPK